MPLSPRKVAWIAASAGAASLTGALMQLAMERAWRAATDDDPPDDPDRGDSRLSHVLLWSASTAAVVGLAQVLARRAAHTGWRRATGRRPPRG